ncbi:EAL domain-containing protein [Williamsia muralis]|uniref:sensor domain-containing phosphodiesterase n=1 Tax=Williamsia marianensis TaxID=85044 RepID=UPI003F161464
MMDRSDDPPSGIATVPIACLYQPIVDLRTGETTGYEALARWPSRPDLSPGEVFGSARDDGTLATLDRAAQQAALHGAREAGLPRSYTLFINVEADTSSSLSLTADMFAPEGDARPGRVVIEITERALLVDPGRVLEIADEARALGWGVALDDVGSNPDCLTMLDFVAPEIIKIDGPLTRTRRPTPVHTATLAAIAAYVEATPATELIAEGIETQADLEQALALGATHGQGWLLGYPAPLPEVFPPVSNRMLPHTAVHNASLSPPSEALKTISPRIGRKSLLITLSRHLEDMASTLRAPVTVLATFQDAASFGPVVAERFSTLAATHPNAYVAAFGVDMPTHPAAGVVGVPLNRDDNLVSEWTITVTGPHYFGALIARDLGDPPDDPDRRYEYTLTHDRSTVTTAARALMRRIHHRNVYPSQSVS